MPSDAQPAETSTWRLDARSAVPYAPASALALMGAAALAVSREVVPAVVLALGAAAALAVAVAAVATVARRSLDREAALALATAGFGPALLALSTLEAVNGTVSFAGIAGQHAGAALWLLAWTYFALTALTGTRHSLLWTLRVIAVLGALFALTAAMQAAGAFGGAPGWGFASAPLENSISLAEWLVLAVGAGAAWLAASRGAERVVAGLATALALAGLVPARSSGAWVALALGAAFFGLHALVRRLFGSRAPAALATAWTALALVGTLALAGVSAGWIGEGAYATLNRASNQRGAIWRAAVTSIAQHPWTGRGAEQFTAWAGWQVDGTRVSTQGALDAHNALLAMALAIGVPAALAVLASAGLLLYLLAARIARTGDPLAVRVALAALAAWASTLAFAWVAILPALAAAVLAGALVAATRPSPTAAAGAAPGTAVRRRSAAAALVIAALVALAVAFAAWPALSAEWRWFSVRESGGQSADLGARLYAQHRDPTFAIGAEQELMALALSSSATQGERAAAAKASRDISAEAARDRVWHGDLAFDALTLATRTYGAPDERAYAAALEAGVRSDAASGLWYFLASRHAAARGDVSAKLAFDREALAYIDLPPSVRAMLAEEVAAGR